MLTSLHVQPVFSGRRRDSFPSVACACMIIFLNATIALWEHIIWLVCWEVDPQGHNLPIRWGYCATNRGLPRDEKRRVAHGKTHPISHKFRKIDCIGRNQMPPSRWGPKRDNDCRFGSLLS
jgi:hypothetical protein